MKIQLSKYTPIRLFGVMVILIFSSEVTMMALLGSYAPDRTPYWVEAVVDASVLTALVSVFVWLLFVKPLTGTLLNERAQAKGILDGVVESVITIAENGVIQSCNRSTESMFGYRSGELLGKNVKILMPEPYSGKHDGYLAHYVHGGKSSVIGTIRELEAVRKDGTVFAIELSVAELKFAGKRRFTGIIRDINDRKTAQQSSQRETKRFKALMDASIDGIVIVDGEGFLVHANPSFLQMLGCRNEAESKGLRVSDWAPDFPPEVVKATIPTLIGGRQTIESRILRKDSSILDVEVSISGFTVEAENYFLAVARDISARKRAQQDLSESEERFRSLVEQSIAGISIVQDGVTTYANPRFAEIFGYVPEEIIGRPPTLLVAEEDRALVEDNIRRRVAGEVRSIQYNFIGKRKDGSRITVGVHGAVASVGGRPAIIGMMQDISEKKRAEEQISQYVTQLQSAFMSTVRVATSLGEMRDPYTAGHQRRVAEIAVAIGAEIGLDARAQEGLRIAGYLHDIGKITVPAEILSRPGKLSAIEFSLIKGHCQAGYDVLKDIEFPWPVAEVALQHHERVDGSGYPQGLTGDKIRLESKIIAVADVVEAISSHRPYRPALGIEAALGEIESKRGSAYDAGVVDCCLRLFRDKGFALPA